MIIAIYMSHSFWGGGGGDTRESQPVDGHSLGSEAGPVIMGLPLLCLWSMCRPVVVVVVVLKGNFTLRDTARPLLEAAAVSETEAKQPLSHRGSRF